jgi:acetyl esterase
MFMALDPDIKGLLDAMAAMEQPPIDEIPVADVRASFLTMSPLSAGPGAADVDVENRTIPGPGGQIPIRIYTPRAAGAIAPIVVYYHGGGWVIGNLDTHDATCRDLSSQSGAIFVSVDYRLAPESRFPAAADDSYAALVWAHEHASELGGDRDRMAVAGDSAGGNLAAVTAVRARDEGGPALRLQLLAYPVTDGGLDTPSMKENAKGYFLTRDGMAWFWDLYTGTDPDGARNDPRASVLRTEDLRGVAPALVLTAEFDPLRDEGEDYGRRLTDAGVATTARRYDGLIHGFLGLQGISPAAAVILTETAATLTTALA